MGGRNSSVQDVIGNFVWKGNVASRGGGCFSSLPRGDVGARELGGRAEECSDLTRDGFNELESSESKWGATSCVPTRLVIPRYMHSK